MIKAINNKLSRIKANLLDWIDVCLVESQKKRLIEKLKSCGKNPAFQMPVCITGHCEVEIGDDVSMAAFVHIWGGGGVKIGNRVMIGSHSALSSLTHDYSCEVMNKSLIKGKITIGDDVWIGAHSVILPGVTVGRGAVIGAGSVLTNNVEAYSITFGVPAKHYKFREIKK